MKLIVLLATFAIARAQWLEDCGQSQYPDAGQGQEWSRVVGGVVARDNEFPWQIAVEINGVPTCGGNILNSNYIIEAAHCSAGYTEANLTVFTERIFRTSGGVRYDVAEIIQHPGFDPVTVDNDIGLLRTAQTMDLSSVRASGICPPRATTYDGAFLTVSGWGTTAADGDFSEDLLYANVIGISNANCSESYAIFNDVTDRMICADSPFDRDACINDSGGPLAFNNGGSFEVVGTVSWGVGCASLPGVYARVSEFLDWIAANAT